MKKTALNTSVLFIKASILITFTYLLGCQDSPNFREVGPVYGPIYKGGEVTLNLGIIDAEKNGIPFSGNARYLNHDIYCKGCFSLQMITYEDSIDVVDFLNISNLNLNKVGMYDIFANDPTNETNGEGIGIDKKTEIFYDTFLGGGDTEGDTYELYEEFPNWLEIVSVDTMSRIIRGTFEMHFEKVIENDSRNPKYVRFSNVQFEANIN